MIADHESRSRSELLDMLIQIAAHPADAVLAHALDGELLDERSTFLVDTPLT
jgi:hypothetical protein